MCRVKGHDYRGAMMSALSVAERRKLPRYLTSGDVVAICGNRKVAVEDVSYAGAFLKTTDADFCNSNVRLEFFGLSTAEVPCRLARRSKGGLGVQFLHHSSSYADIFFLFSLLRSEHMGSSVLVLSDDQPQFRRSFPNDRRIQYSATLLNAIEQLSRGVVDVLVIDANMEGGQLAGIRCNFEEEFPEVVIICTEVAQGAESSYMAPVAPCSYCGTLTSLMVEAGEAVCRWCFTEPQGVQLRWGQPWCR